MTHSTRAKCTEYEVAKITIPYRHWYSIAETAQLTGMSDEFIRDGIRKGQRRNVPDDAITCVRKFGTQWRIHRSYIYPDEPQNVTPMRHALTTDQVEAAVERVLSRMFGRMFSGTWERIA
jgi:hypothetical protein